MRAAVATTLLALATPSRASFATPPSFLRTPSRSAARVAAAPVCKIDVAATPPSDVRVLVVGATGYIGRFVTKELVRRGYQVTALAREQSGVGGKKGRADVVADFPGAKVAFGDVTDAASLRASGFAEPVDVVVSCLASRTGGVEDSNRIDYGASKNAIDELIAQGGSHYVLLSAICVQKPLLEFQRAKASRARAAWRRRQHAS